MDKGKSDEDEGKDSVIIFDGKEPNRAAKWFELSQATERFAEYHCGSPGVEIWLGVSPELTEESPGMVLRSVVALLNAALLAFIRMHESQSSSFMSPRYCIPVV